MHLAVEERSAVAIPREAFRQRLNSRAALSEYMGRLVPLEQALRTASTPSLLTPDRCRQAEFQMMRPLQCPTSCAGEWRLMAGY